MKPQLISLLRCPKCKSLYFRLKKLKKDDAEIRKGKVVCKNCSLNMEIDGGILNCLYKPPKIVLNEIKENKIVANKREKKTDKWLLSLPLADNKRGQGISHFS